MAAHGGTGAHLDTVDGVDAQGVVDGLENFGLGDLLAAAEDLAVVRVLRDGGGPLLVGHIGKTADAVPDGIKVGIGLQRLLPGDEGHGPAGQREGGGDAGGLDAHQVDHAGRLVPALQYEVLYRAGGGVDALGPDAGKIADEVGAVHVLEHPRTALNEAVHGGLGGLVVLEIPRQLAVGPHQYISVHGGRGMGVKRIVRIGGGIDGNPGKLARQLVKDEVFAFDRLNDIAGNAQLPADHGGVEPRAVHHPAGVKVAPGGVEQVGAVGLPGLAGESAVEVVLRPVVNRVLRQGNGVEEGVQDTAGRAPHGEISAGAGVKLIHPLAVDELQALHAVGLAPGHELLQPQPVFIGEAHDELAGALKGDIQLAGHLVELLVALHGADGLEGAGLIEEPGVEHAGVAPTGLGADVALLLQHGDAQLVPGELPGDGAAHHPAADDDDIIGLLHRDGSFLHQRNRVKMGTVTRLVSVEINTHLEANWASAPYFCARMAVVEPMGMPVSTTLTPAVRGSTPSSRRATRHTAGSRSWRTATR